ncbi:hypothetical protein [Rhodoferax sp.]|uniref:hypothetical protein n=1 Tax=Rhodoferax sp. TaxID=50421 RepID=UPI00260315F0|nr:hypothetical protein [Rhodoferax sp.]MDD3936858.1 hypothetical protein [Rhodoferax sp.]
MSAAALNQDAEFVAATAATVALYFQHGLALMAAEFGVKKCDADSAVLAGFVQACAVIHAADLLGADLDGVVGERLFKLAKVIEEAAQ